MRWASALSERESTESAVAEAALALRTQLGSAQPDLLLAFVSPHHAGAYEQVPLLSQGYFPRAALIGCAGGGIIGAGHEVENRPALSLTAAVLPGVELKAFHIDSAELPALEGNSTSWRALVGFDSGDPLHFVLVADPYSCDVERLIQDLDAAYPLGRKVGGLASGGTSAGANALFVGGSLHRGGVAAVTLRGDIEVDTIVAQGCRPIGRPMLVTRCHEHFVLELDRRPPLEQLRELHQSLPDNDRELFRHSLFAGIEMREDTIEYHQGDFLIRNLVGVDPESGALAIGARLKPWQVLQFHLRDAETAAADLASSLARFRTSGGQPPRGALLFSCLGRGQNLYGRSGHDSRLFLEQLGSVPLGGFFCNGEIGPVGRNTFLHGYTSAFGLFREKSDAMRS